VCVCKAQASSFPHSLLEESQATKADFPGHQHTNFLSSNETKVIILPIDKQNPIISEPFWLVFFLFFFRRETFSIPLVPLGLKETKEVDFTLPLKVNFRDSFQNE